MTTDMVKAEVFQGIPLRMIWKDGIAMIPLVDIADAIGYERTILTQLIRRNEAIFEGLKGVSVMNTPRGPQEHVCLTRDGVIGLLMKLDHQRVKDPKVKDRVLAFQRWAIETLGNVMDGKTPIPLAPVEKTYESFAPLIKDEMEISKIMSEYGIPTNLSLAIAIARIEERTGLVMTKYKAALPPAETTTAFFTPTELGAQLGLSGKDVNRILALDGFQYRLGSQWELTEKGKPHAVRTFAATTNWSGFQLKWSSDVLQALRPYSRGVQQPCIV